MDMGTTWRGGDMRHQSKGGAGFSNQWASLCFMLPASLSQLHKLFDQLRELRLDDRKVRTSGRLESRATVLGNRFSLHRV